MLYNKNQFKKVTNRKILHKVKKHWITISVAMLGLIGGGTVTAANVSANAAGQGNNDNSQQANHSLNTNQTKSQKSKLVGNYQSGTKQPSSSVATTQTITRRTNHWYRHAVSNGAQSVSQSSSTSKTSIIKSGSVRQSSSASVSAHSESAMSVSGTASMASVLRSDASAIDSYNQVNKSYANVILFDLGSLSDSNNNALNYAKNNVAKYYPQFMSFMTKESDVANSLGEQANDPNTSAVSAASDNLSKVSLLNNKAGMVMSKYIEPWEAQSAESANGSSASNESSSANNSSNGSTSNDSSVNSNSVNVSSSASASASVSALNSESVANSIQNSIVVSKYASSVSAADLARSLRGHNRHVNEPIANNATHVTNPVNVNNDTFRNTSRMIDSTNHVNSNLGAANERYENSTPANSRNGVGVNRVSHNEAPAVNRNGIQSQAPSSATSDQDVSNAADNDPEDSDVNDNTENNEPVDDPTMNNGSNDGRLQDPTDHGTSKGITDSTHQTQQPNVSNELAAHFNRKSMNAKGTNRTQSNRSNNKLPQTNETPNGEALAEISLIMSTTLGALSAYIDKHRED